MRFFTLRLTLFCLFQTTLVLGQTPPSVSDTIELNFDTIALPKRGPNFSNYYGSGQRLFATTLLPDAIHLNVYESSDLGATWHVKFEKVLDFIATDSAIIYCQYVYGNPISVNTWSGNTGYYKIFVSTDSGNSFVVTDSTYVEYFRGGRYVCEDEYRNLQKLNDSVFIYGIYKPCNIYNPVGLSYVPPYSMISKDKGRTWARDVIEKKPNYVINGTTFIQKDSFLRFTRRADFVYDDVIKLPFSVLGYSFLDAGKSFVSGVFSGYENDRDGSHNGNTIIRFTSDKGLTWQTDSLAFRMGQLVQYKDTVFILSDNVLYRSKNGNPHKFSRIYPQSPINRTTLSGLSILSSGIYLNGADGALLRSSDGGNTWQIRNNTVGSVSGDSKLYAFGEDIWFYDQSVPAFYHFEDTSLVKRVDTLSRIIPNFSFSYTAFSKDSMYLTEANMYGYGMSRSRDKGLTWEGVPIDRFTPKLDSNNVYGIVRDYQAPRYVISNDNTLTFSTHLVPEKLWDLAIKKNKVWAVVGQTEFDTKVIRSVDSGQTWVTVFKYSGFHSPFTLTMEGETLWLNTAIVVVNTWHGLVYRSTNEGITWTQMSDIPELYKPLMTRKKGYLFIRSNTESPYIFISKNDGITWTRVTNAPNLFVTDKYIYTSKTAASFTGSAALKLSRFPIDSLANKIKSDKTYSLLRGRVFKDKNTNCREDGTDTPIFAKMLRFNGGYNTSTDQNGRFSIMLPIDTYKIEIANERYFALSCGSDTALKQVILRPNQTTDTTLFFQKTKTVRDIAITLTANGRPRPANELKFVLQLKNVGTETADSLTVQFDFSNMPVQLVSASPNAVLNGQKLTWFRRNFLSDADELLRVNLRIDTFAPLSTNLRFYAQTDILNEMDSFPSDNRDSTRLMIVGSYDPNDKSVLPDGKIPLSASIDTFDYTIRFQNTGTDTAYKVVIVDTLPNLLDPYSLRIKSASHAYQLNVNKNVLIFTFDKIMLPDSFTNERASHGFIRYTVNPKNRLAKGETLDNRAHIFFDYNSAIMTNTAQNNVYKPTIQTQQTVTLCEGDSWKNVIYTRSTIRIDTVQKALVDLVHTTFIVVNPTFSKQIDTTVRLGDTLFGRRLEVNQKIVFQYLTVFGCDSSIVYNIRVEKANKTSDLALSKINISVAPNPANNWLSINYNLNEPLETDIYALNVLGQKCQIIKQKALDTEGVHTVRLDVRNFAAGMYQVILQTPHGRKIIGFSKI